MNDLMTQSFLNYVDLKKQAEHDLKSEGEFTEVELIEQRNPKLNPTDEANLSKFFKEVEEIKAQMEEIPTLLNDLKALNDEAKSTHSAKALRGLRDRMDSDTVSILRKAKTLKARLESLDRSNSTNRRVSVAFGEGGTAVHRTRAAVTNGLRVKFKDMITGFTLLREKILEDLKEDVRRKHFNATGEVPSEETVEKIVATGSLKTEVYKENFGAKKEREEAVKDIKRSLDKLHQVFLDMAMLVEGQGEQIDDIEKNMASAGDFISGGTDSLHYAKQMKKRGKKWVILLWALGFIVLLVCLVSLLAS